MFSKALKELMLKNRLARLESSGKENYSIRNKIKRQLRKF